MKNEIIMVSSYIAVFLFGIIVGLFNSALSYNNSHQHDTCKCSLDEVEPGRLTCVDADVTEIEEPEPTKEPAKTKRKLCCKFTKDTDAV